MKIKIEDYVEKIVSDIAEYFEEIKSKKDAEKTLEYLKEKVNQIKVEDVFCE